MSSHSHDTDHRCVACSGINPAPLLTELRKSATDYTDMGFLRASVTNVCNLDCIYCPKSAGMENYVPAELALPRLSLNEYCERLALFSQLGFQGVCFTGGEPTANPHLPEILHFAKKYYEVVELTTNGLLFSKMLPRLVGALDRVKISIDSLDKEVFGRIVGDARALDPALDALRLALENSLRVTVNTVVMRRTIQHIPSLLDFLTGLADEFPGQLSWSIYDMYFTTTTRGAWEREFVPLTCIEGFLDEMLPTPRISGVPDRRFIEYNSGQLSIAMKDTYGATPRIDDCAECNDYCQEGVCSLRVSVEGWVTTCPSSQKTLGALFSSTDPTTLAFKDIKVLATKYHGAYLSANTITQMIHRHKLHPDATPIRILPPKGNKA